MFNEANFSNDGKMDAEQLGKAVSGKFPYREYNESWLRFFESAPRDTDKRLTVLPPESLEREPVRASFEQVRLAPASQKATLGRSAAVRVPCPACGLSCLAAHGPSVARRRWTRR